MSNDGTLPPGQRLYPGFDRFGLGLFAHRFPAETARSWLAIGGAVAHSLVLGMDGHSLPRVEQVSDFHCVTTWSVQGLRWSGWRFADVYQRLIAPLAGPADACRYAILYAQDGYAVNMLLEDLMAPGVLLADSLNGAPLGIDHGAPLRLVAPAHYGYKNIKHLVAIDFRRDRRGYRFPFPYPTLMDHPRGRVAQEERASHLPNWLIRPLYRALQPPARRKHARALARYASRD